MAKDSLNVWQATSGFTALRSLSLNEVVDSLKALTSSNGWQQIKNYHQQ